MKCTHCGKTTPQNAKYCIHCGSEIESTYPLEGVIQPVQPSKEMKSVREDRAQNAGEISTAQALLISQNFIGSAFLTWIMYYVGFYVVGLFMNIMFLNQAKKISRVSDTSPSGRGCLQVLFITHFWIPLVIFIFIVILAISSGQDVVDTWKDLIRQIEDFF
jgi:hypothetical protein